jgi:hypothetical protein
MRALGLSVAAILVALMLVLGFGARAESGAAVPPAPRVFCAHPGSLGLRRFEDGSARLECAGRTLARVSVPG